MLNNMVTNKEVLEKMAERRNLCSIKKRRNGRIGHVMRHSGLLKLILEGFIEGKNARGRPPKKYIQQIIKDQGS